MPIILFALLSALCLLRIPAVVKVKESRASWLASVFGLLALYFLGIVTPLETIDSYLGGFNLTNLLQAVFALLAIFFFNDSVRQLAKIPPASWTYYGPLLTVPVMIACFTLIDDKAPTTAEFIAIHMDQLATAAYSGSYMFALLYTVLRLVYMLRHKASGLLSMISIGMLVVAGGCASHFAYVVLFYFSPWDAPALELSIWFDRLFYLGLSITAASWLLLFFSRHVPRIRLWMADALWLTALRIHVNSDRTRFAPAWDFFNETLEDGIYKSLIDLHNHERANQVTFKEPIQDRINQIEAKLNTQIILAR